MKRLMIAATMLSAATLTAAPAQADDLDLIEQLQGYLQISEQFIDLVNRKEAAVFFAVEGIVEIHEERGDQAKAIPTLQAFLEKYPDDQAVRNIIRFKLRDLYRETGQADLAIAELEVVVEENR
ncbi:MAG: tetratricopeptide repeat protein [Pseudomonadota bacterium]